MADVPVNCKRFTAEQILRLVQKNMSQAERRRLGMLLARSGELLPGWRTVQAIDHEPLNGMGLSGISARLFDYCHGRWRSDTDAIRHIWPAEAACSRDINRDVRLRQNLRQLKSRTNKVLALHRAPFTLVYEERKITVVSV